jgi:hypothetical protein
VDAQYRYHPLRSNQILDEKQSAVAILDGVGSECETKFDFAASVPKSKRFSPEAAEIKQEDKIIALPMGFKALINVLGTNNTALNFAQNVKCKLFIIHFFRHIEILIVIVLII